MPMQTDIVIKNFFASMKNICWKTYDEHPNMCWYYAEECQYLVMDKETNAIWFIKAKSPVKAYECVINKLSKGEAE